MGIMLTVSQVGAGGASAKWGKQVVHSLLPPRLPSFECSPYASAPGILQGVNALWISRVGEEG